jgi:hypothetical protein
MQDSFFRCNQRSVTADGPGQPGRAVRRELPAGTALGSGGPRLPAGQPPATAQWPHGSWLAGQGVPGHRRAAGALGSPRPRHSSRTAHACCSAPLTRPQRPRPRPASSKTPRPAPPPGLSRTTPTPLPPGPVDHRRQGPLRPPGRRADQRERITSRDHRGHHRRRMPCSGHRSRGQLGGGRSRSSCRAAK